MPTIRDIVKERSAIQQFQTKTGRDPNDLDLQNIYGQVYGADLPQELQKTGMANSGTLNAQNNILSNSSGTPGANLGGLAQGVNQAQARTGQFNAPNQALNILQEAIKTKTKPYEQSVGQSDLFAKAGVGGYGALMSSLQARKDEITQNAVVFQDIVNNMAGVYKDEANAALKNYQTAADMYNKELDRVNELDKLVKNNEYAIKLQEIKHNADKQLELLKGQIAGGEIDLTTGLPFTGMEGATTDQIAQAIKVAEGNVSYDYSKSDRQEKGAYQFMPATWSQWSQEYAAANDIKGSLAMTQENQDAVAKFKIQQYLDQGLSPDQVLAMWNHGSPEYKGVKGISTITKEPYDTEAYVGRGLAALKTITKGNKPQSDNEVNAEMLARGEVPPSMISAFGQARTKALAEAKRIDPNFNPSRAELQFQAAKRWVTTQNGPQMTRFYGLATSVVNTIDEVRDLSEQLKLSGIQLKNRIEMEAYAQLNGNSAKGQLVARYLGATNTLKEEFANLAQGGYAPTEAAWSLANKQINENYGVQQLGASLIEVQRLINYRVNALSSITPVIPNTPNTSSAATTTDDKDPLGILSLIKK